MEHLAIISHNSLRANGFHKSRSPSSPNGPAPQGSQLITLGLPSGLFPTTWKVGISLILGPEIKKIFSIRVMLVTQSASNLPVTSRTCTRL